MANNRIISCPTMRDMCRIVQVFTNNAANIVQERQRGIRR